MTTAEAPVERQLPYVAAVIEAIAQLMREDPDVFLAGEEDVGVFMAASSASAAGS